MRSSNELGHLLLFNKARAVNWPVQKKAKTEFTSLRNRLARSPLQSRCDSVGQKLVEQHPSNFVHTLHVARVGVQFCLQHQYSCKAIQKFLWEPEVYANQVNVDLARHVTQNRTPHPNTIQWTATLCLPQRTLSSAKNNRLTGQQSVKPGDTASDLPKRLETLACPCQQGEDCRHSEPGEVTCMHGASMPPPIPSQAPMRHQNPARLRHWMAQSREGT